jgi:hypothetical protein
MGPRLLLVLSLLIAMQALSVGQVEAAAWQLLGEREVNYRTDRGVVRVTVSEGLFRKTDPRFSPTICCIGV